MEQFGWWLVAAATVAVAGGLWRATRRKVVREARKPVSARAPAMPRGPSTTPFAEDTPPTAPAAPAPAPARAVPPAIAPARAALPAPGQPAGLPPAVAAPSPQRSVPPAPPAAAAVLPVPPVSTPAPAPVPATPPAPPTASMLPLEAPAAAPAQRAIEAARTSARLDAPPRPAQTAPDVAAPRTAPPSAGPAVRRPSDVLVLVVDDSKVARVKATRLLAAQGYRCATADDGVQALAAVEREGPQIVISDVEMPGLDGLDLTRRLRADRRFVALPLVMITSADERLHAEARAAGVTALLGKPYADTALLELVARHAGVAGTAQA